MIPLMICALGLTHQAPPTIVVDGEKVDVDAIIRKGRTMVPARSVFERLGATVRWVPTEGMVLAEKGSTVVRVWVGEEYAQVGQRRFRMDVYPTNTRGVVRVPLRFISHTFGASVRWDPATRTVTIDSSPGNGR